ncbi:glycosyltransferase [Haliea atlantica]
MKISLLMISFAGGGVTRVMLSLAEGLLSRGIAVDLLVLRASGEFLPQVPPGARVVDLRAASTLRALFPLLRYLARERPSAVLSATTRINCAAVCAWWLAGRRGRLVLSEHTTPSHFLRTQRGISARLVPRLMRWSYPHASAVVAVSRQVADDVAACAALDPRQVRVVHNPVVSEQLHAQANEALQHPWFEPGAAPVMLAVGRLSVEKDFPVLIRAFARVRKQREARLLILGEGAERAALQAGIDRLGLAEDVQLAGFVDNPYAYMRAADVVVLSSRTEAMPTVLIEALACGATVIATDCPHGPAEILEGGRWGRLVPVGDVVAMASAIEAALATPRDGRGRERAAHFSREAAVVGYLAVLGVRQDPN